jgi:CBS domain containing-hemolysin-like protein
MILTLLVYALVSAINYSFGHLEESVAKSGKRAGQVSYFLDKPQVFHGTVMQFSIVCKLLIVFLAMELLNSHISAGLLAVVLMYSVSELVAITLRGRGNDFFQKTVYFTIVMSAVAAPLNRLFISLTSIPDGEREERDVQSIEEITESHDDDDYKDLRERKLLRNIVSLSNTSVSDIMKPRVDVIAVNTSMSAGQVMDVAVECGYSRLPVYENNLDNIKGFLYIKDLVGFLQDKSDNYDWKSHIREAYFVPGSKKIGDLLEEFRHKKIHLALVADEYGGTDGVVTLEDVLEEIVGEISDESDKTE